jgi:hypothetical protein
MTTKFLIATDAAATTFEDITGLINWETAKFGGSAHRGEIFTANGFDWLDDAGSRTIPNYRVCMVIEDATTPDTVLFRGRTIGNRTARGVIVTEPAKVFDVSLVDHNKDFGGQAFVGTSRPAEDDDDRVRFLLETYLQGQNRPSTNLTDTYLQSTTPVALPAYRYEAVAAIDWFNHIIESTGKQFFITVDSELFYGPVTSTVYAADLSITDVLPAGADEYYPIDAAAFEDGGEMFTGVRRRISGGRVVTTVRDAVELANDRWRTGIVDEEVQSVLAATTRNNKFLDEFDHTQFTYTCAIDLDETEVDKIKYGQTVSVRSAAMGLLSPTTLRIGSLQWTKISADRYRANLELGYPTKFGRRSGGTGSTTPTPGPTPYVPSEPQPDVVLEFCNTVMIDSGREGSATSVVSWVIGQSYYYRITNTAHSATAITDDFLFTGSGTGQVTGAIPDGADEGTIVPTLAGAIGAAASADYSGAPTVHECWKVEIWIGETSLPASAPVFGQWVVESYTADGVLDTFQTNHPYQENGILTFVDGVQVVPDQDDPENGEGSFAFVPDAGATVVLAYWAASGISTGASNDSTPSATTPTSVFGIPATLLDTKGDIITATAADTPVRKAAGANDTILMADSGQSDGLKWVGSQTPTTQDYDDVAAEGTADTYARGDHLHGMPSAGGGGSITVEDEGTPLTTAATTLDFVGAGVTASGTGATKTITIPGGGGGDPFDGKPYIWTPPGSAATEDDEFNDDTSMSGPVNGLDAKWTKRNLGTAAWFVLDDAVAPGCAYFDIPTGQASDQAIYQTVPAGDWTFAAHMHGHRSSDRQYWGVFCVSSAGTGIMAVMDTGADTSNGLRTLTTWADGGAGTFHGEAAWNTDENGLNRNPSVPVTVTLRKASGVYHMGYSYSQRLLPGNYFEISHTPTAFTAAFVGVGRFGPAGTAGVSKVTIDFFRKVA